MSDDLIKYQMLKGIFVQMYFGNSDKGIYMQPLFSGLLILQKVIERCNLHKVLMLTMLTLKR